MIIFFVFIFFNGDGGQGKERYYDNEEHSTHLGYK